MADNRNFNEMHPDPAIYYWRDNIDDVDYNSYLSDEVEYNLAT